MRRIGFQVLLAATILVALSCGSGEEEQPLIKEVTTTLVFDFGDAYHFHDSLGYLYRFDSLLNAPDSAIDMPWSPEVESVRGIIAKKHRDYIFNGLMLAVYIGNGGFNWIRIEKPDIDYVDSTITVGAEIVYTGKADDVSGSEIALVTPRVWFINDKNIKIYINYR